MIKTIDARRDQRTPEHPERTCEEKKFEEIFESVSVKALPSLPAYPLPLIKPLDVHLVPTPWPRDMRTEVLDSEPEGKRKKMENFRGWAGRRQRQADTKNVLESLDKGSKD